PPSTPPVMTAPGPSAAPPPTPAVRPPQETDLASYIEARRRERGLAPPAPPANPAPTTNPDSTTPPTETEAQRRDRIVAANLAPTDPPTFGYDPKRGGGVFQVKTIGYDYAEFYFTGWDKEIGRRAKELIEVRKGSSDDIRQVMVRKMIAIIRDHVQTEFIWVSDRLGRQVTMSARPSDNAALEEFLMQEFFSAPGRRR